MVAKGHKAKANTVSGNDSINTREGGHSIVALKKSSILYMSTNSWETYPDFHSKLFFKYCSISSTERQKAYFFHHSEHGIRMKIYDAQTRFQESQFIS